MYGSNYTDDSIIEKGSGDRSKKDLKIKAK